MHAAPGSGYRGWAGSKRMSIEVQVSLGTPANQPLSGPAEAVREVLRSVVANYIRTSSEADRGLQ